MPDHLSGHPPTSRPAILPDLPSDLASAPGPVTGSGGGSRERLARAQADLVAALVAGGEVPEGFDAERLRIQRAGLISKRRGTVAGLRPDLVALLGAGFAAEFEDYAGGRPRPRGGSRADARDFAESLVAKGRLPREPGPVPREPATSRRPSWFWRRFSPWG